MFNRFRKKQKEEPQPLMVEGIKPAPLTSEPDDAEQAAMALLEMMSGHSIGNDQAEEPEKGSKEYYEYMAARIRQAHDASTVHTMRFLAFCEQELAKPHLPQTGTGSLSMLDVELFKRIDTVERVGGELKKRWQRCVAEVTLRKMGIEKEISNKEAKDNTVDKT